MSKPLGRIPKRWGRGEILQLAVDYEVGGMTLEEIGAVHGMTRERIRQLLAKEGVSGQYNKCKRLREENRRVAENALHLWYTGCSVTFISNRLKVPLQTVSKHLGASGVSPKRRHRIHDLEVLAWYEEYKAGATLAVIGAKYCPNCRNSASASSTVYQHFKRLGLPRRTWGWKQSSSD